MKNFSKLFTALCFFVSIGSTSSVYAASTDVILSLEGNPTCSSLAINSITEKRDSSLPGADDPLANPKMLTLEGGVDLFYSISTTDVMGDTINEFYLAAPGGTIVKPINFIIGKMIQNSGALVWHYGPKGVTGDSESLVASNTLKSVTFCYGLDDVILGDKPEVDRCENLDEGELDEVGITCPGGVDYSVHVLRKGERINYSECTCNTTATQCDELLPAGAVGACVARCPSNPSNYPYTFDDVTYESIQDCLAENQLRETPAGVIRPWNNGSGWCGTGMLGSTGCYKW